MIEGIFGNIPIAQIDINNLRQKRQVKRQFEDQKSAINPQNIFSIHVQKPNFDSIKFNSNLLAISYAGIEKDPQVNKFDARNVESMLKENQSILKQYRENLKKSEEDNMVADEFSSTHQNFRTHDIRSYDQTKGKKQHSYNDGFNEKKQTNQKKIIATPAELEAIRVFFISHKNEVSIEAIQMYIDIFQTKDPQLLYKSLQ